MITSNTIVDLVELHKRFWCRTLSRPIINLDCSWSERFGYLPAIPEDWAEKDGLILKPDMLSVDRLQPPPRIIHEKHPLHGEVAFNTWPPYYRIPWLIGMVGAGLRVSTSSQTIWPEHNISNRWYELENLGLVPCDEWLEKLLEFLEYVIKHWYPNTCIPCQDVIGRGPGDLLMGLIGAEEFYLAMHEHPEELHRLLKKAADIYIEWARAQFELLPQIEGGYCNQYGIWSPGTYIRFQEDFAINISEHHYRKFLMPHTRRIMTEFDYPVHHTHSGFSKICVWLAEIEELKLIEVALDPMGPSLRQLIPLWNRILQMKNILIYGELTEDQIDLLSSELSPGGLWIDVSLKESEVIRTE